MPICLVKIKSFQPNDTNNQSECTPSITPGLNAQHPIIPDQSPSVKPILQTMTNEATNPPNPPNPFQILGIKPSFSVTPDQIQRAYLQRLSTAHPDLVSQESKPVLDPATLNQARDTLLSDEARANLMLDLVGGPSPKDKSLPDGFLMEMMELRTQIEEELQADPTEARPRWQAWASIERTKTIATITTLFNSIATTPEADHTQIKQTIRTHLNAWRYTERLIEQLDPTYDPSNVEF